jgi:hypothetical protein
LFGTVFVFALLDIMLLQITYFVNMLLVIACTINLRILPEETKGPWHQSTTQSAAGGHNSRADFLQKLPSRWPAQNALRIPLRRIQPEVLAMCLKLNSGMIRLVQLPPAT